MDRHVWCYYVFVDKAPELKETNISLLTKLLSWVKANLYFSIANVLAALIVLVATVGVIELFTHTDQLELGVLALPFIAWLDVMFIALVASLFIRKPSGFTIFLGFIAVLIVPLVCSTVVINLLSGLSSNNSFPDDATKQLIEGVISWVLGLLYLLDIVIRIRKAKQRKSTS